MADTRKADHRGRHPSPGMNHARRRYPGFRFPFEVQALNQAVYMSNKIRCFIE